MAKHKSPRAFLSLEALEERWMPAQIDYLLKVDSVMGESRDIGNKGAIVIESWSFGTGRGQFASPPSSNPGPAIVTRSSLPGPGADHNEIRFADKKGLELVFIHADKDQHIAVENDEAHWVGHDRTKTIDRDETTQVRHDRTETVDHNETITIHGRRDEKVGKDETLTIGCNPIERVTAQNQDFSFLPPTIQGILSGSLPVPDQDSA